MLGRGHFADAYRNVSEQIISDVENTAAAYLQVLHDPACLFAFQYPSWEALGREPRLNACDPLVTPTRRDNGYQKRQKSTFFQLYGTPSVLIFCTRRTHAA